ncbi:NAD(P)/FAD-dependent oxidoreductase [Acuticoccus kandeliae]|uniref:NAD(P)/FAD-dependent oxidoreductase n=1 Tax=Acuticoccus kandeliae TaxID=2073160 RepID=UPI0014732F97|nr:tryptophan 7-halogenase [Acuticoccus kandeliae]
MSDHQEPKIWDIAIAGSGIASTILGIILAKNGLSVILVEKGEHPQFAIGESTIPQTSLMLKSLALRHDIPELDALTSFENVSRNVSRACGQKSNFGFVFQRPNAHHAPDECHQLGVARANFRESHLYRQDVDSYLLQTAIRYGCKVHQKTGISEIVFADDRVTLTTDRKFDIAARCFVDGSGYVSLLARKLGIRDAEPRLATTTRTMFTHMIDVRPYDEAVPAGTPAPRLTPWHHGTLHHIFREGWMWVIPFNNHDDAMNNVVSVGLQLDPRVRPKPDIDPFEEFQNIIADYPGIRSQFRDAKPIREWISSGRLQYTSSTNVGDRWCLLSHSADFIDPLFSRGLSNSMEVINLAAQLLIEGARKNDFSEKHLTPLKTLQSETARWNDRLVHGAYTSFRDFSLWNAWFRFWGLSQTYGVLRLAKAFTDFERSNDPAAFEHLENSVLPGALTPDHPHIAEKMLNAYAILQEVAEERKAPGEAAKEIFAVYESIPDLPPNFAYTDPATRFGRQGLTAQLEMDHWLVEQLRAA